MSRNYIPANMDQFYQFADRFIEYVCEHSGEWEVPPIALSLRTKCGNPAVFASFSKAIYPVFASFNEAIYSVFASFSEAIHDVKIRIMNNYYWIASSQAHRNDKWNYYKVKK